MAKIRTPQVSMSNKQPKYFIWSILVPAMVSLGVAAVVSPWAQRYWSQPAVKIVGALPIHVHREISMNGVSFADHMLAVIFKAENASASAAPVNLAMIDGCAYIDPLSADSGMLNGSEQSAVGKTIDEIFREREHAVQRIMISGVVREGGNTIPAFGTSYIGVLFPLALGRSGAILGAPGSVSLDGDCSNTKVSNPQPSITQIFEWLPGVDFSKAHPHALRPEFAAGKVKVSLFIGTQPISADPRLIKPVYSLRADAWEKLLLPQMYENPEEAYPPRTDSP